MIPKGGALLGGQITKVKQQPSRTYRLDLENGRILGMIDGLDAVRQTVFQILQTERFEHLIFSGNYGSSLTGVAGKDSQFFDSKISRLIREALLQDDRIKDVVDMQVTKKGDEALVTFTVVTQYGEFEASREV
jgi:hypothetical protein